MMNEEKFTGKAEIYNKFRPSYPKELIDYLYSKIGFTKASIIADIGSGTGIFSRLLLERGSQVYCVEPNDDMRRVSEHHLGNIYAFANYISIKAPAENTGLPDGGIDFVTSAQAFHWFDRGLFKAECRRILNPDGKVVLVWNTRDYNSELINKDYELRNIYSIGTKGLRDTDIPEDFTDFFSDNSYEVLTFRNDMIIDRETYIGMNLSRSYSPRKDENPDLYYGLVKELGELFDEYSIDGVITFSQFAKAYIGKV